MNAISFYYQKAEAGFTKFWVLVQLTEIMFEKLKNQSYKFLFQKDKININHYLFIHLYIM